MCGVQRVATTVLAAFVSMPLLTELAPGKNGFCYKHGAPNGTVPRPATPIPPKTAEICFRLMPGEAAEPSLERVAEAGGSGDTPGKGGAEDFLFKP